MAAEHALIMVTAKARYQGRKFLGLCSYGRAKSVPDRERCSSIPSSREDYVMGGLTPRRVDGRGTGRDSTDFSTSD